MRMASIVLRRSTNIEALLSCFMETVRVNTVSRVPVLAMAYKYSVASTEQLAWLK
jgi:hypothetical protein